MNNQSYDIIGDIHGHHDKLLRLLSDLGYQACGFSCRHPQGRKVIFLGDYLDRGPKVREVLHTVRAMVDGGNALAIMGNHELGAIQGHTPAGNGRSLKPKWPDPRNGHPITVEAFAGREDEWQEWLTWMKRLPLYLDLHGFRAVHACWDPDRIAKLNGKTLADLTFLHLASTSGTPEHDLIETTLKGPELDLPPGQTFTDRQNHTRDRLRSRWWNIPAASRITALAMPDPMPGEGDVPTEILRQIPNYGPREKPVFFGHYWLQPDRIKAPLAPNIACLDYSAAKGDHPLVAYRWDGERVLDAAKFVTATREERATTQAR